LLLRRGADVNARDLFGGTPLGWAGLRGQKNVAALLIASGALVDARTVTGKTPLHLAATAGQKEVVTLLLAHGANRNAKNSDGQTPLQEMEVSDLDPASKTNVAAVLRATAPKSVPARPVMTTPPPATAPPVQGAQTSTQVQNNMPDCTDLGGIARLVMRANPGIAPAVLSSAVVQYQVAMGCREGPQTTKCTWIGDVWTCKTN
jgi:Ankyrin repeats (3 copies)